MIEIFLIISVIINVVFILYSRWLIGILRVNQGDVNDLADQVADYVSHVKTVHEMEMFYGDQTLQNLIQHGTEMIEQIEQLDFLLGELDQEQEGEEV